MKEIMQQDILKLYKKVKEKINLYNLEDYNKQYKNTYETICRYKMKNEILNINTLQKIEISKNIEINIRDNYQSINIYIINIDKSGKNYFKKESVSYAVTSLNISKILPYYKFEIIKKSQIKIENIKNILKYLNNNGFEELNDDFLETKLDINGGDFMTFSKWEEISKNFYKESYLNTNSYYLDEMEFGNMKKDRKKDFDCYCKNNYEGEFKLKHLLFGEDIL